MSAGQFLILVGALLWIAARPENETLLAVLGLSALTLVVVGACVWMLT